MRTVAIRTDGSFHRAVFDGATVHAVLIREEGLRADAVGFHQELLPVASTAGFGNMSAIDRRVGRAAGEHFVGAAVAVLAIGCNLSAGDDLRMRAVCVSILRAGMAVSAEDLLRLRLVRQTLHVLVAVNACKLHRSVDRVLELFRIHEKRHGLAIHIGGEG